MKERNRMVTYLQERHRAAKQLARRAAMGWTGVPAPGWETSLRMHKQERKGMKTGLPKQFEIMVNEK